MVFLAILVFLLSSITSYAQIPPSLGWYEIPNTKLSPVCVGASIDARCQNIAAWSSGVMDTRRNRMVIWGGGLGHFGNEIYAVNLNGTPTVERLTDPTAGGCSMESCDG